MGITIRTVEEVIDCSCDSCHKDLSGTLDSPNYGKLEHHFGYGSPLDNIQIGDKLPALVLCEGCWTKALAAIEFKTDPETWEPENSKTEDKSDGRPS